tara:strand:+ start:2796 stop:3155 length:360 start_codon:yes stop_codon:yes gene_type:complete
MKVNLHNVKGRIIKDNETYKLEDNYFLNNLVLSRTTLKPGQMTNGHSHNDEEEVYIFTSGMCLIQIGDDYYHAEKDDTFLIPAGKFHRVFNKSEGTVASFTCIFQKYDRNGNNAIYKNS